MSGIIIESGVSLSGGINFIPSTTIPLGFSSSLFSISSQTLQNVWEQHTIDISSYASATVRVVFWYLRGTSFTGDIQIDDIYINGTTYTFESGVENFIRNSVALSAGTSHTTYPSTMTTTGLTTGTAASFFNRDSAGTPSSGTSSTIDHTLGTTAGFYVYAETSGGATGTPFFLATPSITLSGSPGNMTFWTSRYGATIGTLQVYVYVESV